MDQSGIVYDLKVAGLHADPLQLLLFDRAIEHCGLCAGLSDGHPHRFPRVSDGNHVGYVPELFVVAAFIENSDRYYPAIHVVAASGSINQASAIPGPLGI
ncbi:hypothetical protein [Bradyrhizobium sp. USDA 3315]